MTIHECALYLAGQLAPSLEYEYYSGEELAQKCADAMSMATGSCWLVKKDETAPVKYWVVRMGK